MAAVIPYLPAMVCTMLVRVFLSQDSVFGALNSPISCRFEFDARAVMVNVWGDAFSSISSATNCPIGYSSSYPIATLSTAPDDGSANAESRSSSSIVIVSDTIPISSLILSDIRRLCISSVMSLSSAMILYFGFIATSLSSACLCLGLCRAVLFERLPAGPHHIRPDAGSGPEPVPGCRWSCHNVSRRYSPGFRHLYLCKLS